MDLNYSVDDFKFGSVVNGISLSLCLHVATSFYTHSKWISLSSCCTCMLLHPICMCVWIHSELGFLKWWHKCHMWHFRAISKTKRIKGDFGTMWHFGLFNWEPLLSLNDPQVLLEHEIKYTLRSLLNLNHAHCNKTYLFSFSGVNSKLHWFNGEGTQVYNVYTCVTRSFQNIP